jgi:hypothetical protein
MKAQSGIRGIAPLFFYLGSRWVWVVNATPPPLYPQDRDPVPIVQEVRWAPPPVWTRVENLALAEIFVVSKLH